jgi:regulatory protein
MAKISKLKHNKSNQNISIFLDGEFWVSLTESNVLEFELYKGKEINGAEKEEIVAASDFSRLLTRLKKYINRRPKSKFEVSRYIDQRLEVEAELKQKLINSLVETGFLNDGEFANWFIQNRLDHSNKGLKKIRAELIAKGVNSGVVKSVISGFKFQNLKERASEKIKEEIEKFLKKKHDNKLNLYSKPVQKLVRRLAGRGFKYNQIRDVLAEYNIS